MRATNTYNSGKILLARSEKRAKQSFTYNLRAHLLAFVRLRLAIARALCRFGARVYTKINLQRSSDPTWKIIHLYSVELFATSVRSKARGLCNVVARVGSMAGPLVSGDSGNGEEKIKNPASFQILLLRDNNPIMPFWLFTALLTVEFFVLVVCMPSKTVEDLAAAATTAAATSSPPLLKPSSSSLSKEANVS